ncbi:uncharacterized protein LOC143209745 [Lasioglossum baleicum]|uniref:uncharacterized protein LOC143209745 n=1 Tax=Lasioglossum baleicum TaxID=434251 RepID=UPI003FCE6A9F
MERVTHIVVEEENVSLTDAMELVMFGSDEERAAFMRGWMHAMRAYNIPMENWNVITTVRVLFENPPEEEE